MIYLLIATIFYTVGLLLITVASRNLSSILVAGFSNLMAMLLPLSLALHTLKLKTLQNNRYGLAMALLSGICIAIFSVTISKSLAVTKVGVVAPVIYGGTIVLSTLLSMVFLEEKITLLEAVGLFVLTIGFGIVIYSRATA